SHLPLLLLYFFHDTPTTEIYTLSLHDALPISLHPVKDNWLTRKGGGIVLYNKTGPIGRFVFSMRLPRGGKFGIIGGTAPVRTNRSEEHTSELSHDQISYAVFCLKKKKKRHKTT